MTELYFIVLKILLFLCVFIVHYKDFLMSLFNR